MLRVAFETMSLGLRPNVILTPSSSPHHFIHIIIFSSFDRLLRHRLLGTATGPDTNDIPERQTDRRQRAL